MAIFRATYGYGYREEFSVILTVSDSKSKEDATKLLKEMRPGGYSIITVRNMKTQNDLISSKAA